jgi:hypothetical protein
MILRCQVTLPGDFDLLSESERQSFFQLLWCQQPTPDVILDLEPPEHNAQLLSVAITAVSVSASHVEVSYELGFTKFRACLDQQCDWRLKRLLRGTRTEREVLFESYR